MAVCIRYSLIVVTHHSIDLIGEWSSSNVSWVSLEVTQWQWIDKDTIAKDNANVHTILHKNHSPQCKSRRRWFAISPEINVQSSKQSIVRCCKSESPS